MNDFSTVLFRATFRSDNRAAVKLLRSIAVLAAMAAMASCLFELEYSVGGTVTGLKGTGLVLQDNSGNDLRVNTNGTFTFSSRVAKGKAYLVDVRTQPSNPAQICAVHDGSGTIEKSNITSVVVTCSQAGRYAYVVNQSAGTISAFSIDSSNGFLTPVAGSPFASTGAAPVALAVDPNGAFLYVVNSTSNTVGVYVIDDASGALKVRNFSIVTGAGPAAVSADPTGRFLFVANSGANSVSAFTMQNGVATPVYFNDGDSFRPQSGPLKGQQSRLSGYNTMESFGSVHKWGAFNAHELYVNAKQATLEARRGVWHCDTDGKKDGYGRLLLFCKDLAIDLINRATTATPFWFSLFPAPRKSGRDFR